VIRDGAVQGYFLTRLSYTVEAEKVKKLTIPVPDLVTDALYSALVGDAVIDISGESSFDLEAFKSQVKDTLNGRLGEVVFHDVVVEQIDYLSKEEIRSNMRRGSASPRTDESLSDPADGELPEPPAPSN